MIKLKDINYSIEDKKILHDINLEFEKGKFYGLIGPNGSGKSTLLDIIVGHKEFDNGEILIEDKKLKEYKIVDYAKKIALVPQEFDTHFNYTAREIIEMGRYPYINNENESVAGKKLIDHFIHKFAIEKLLEKSITEMSGGERQRVLFIKALVQDTDYILLDEATSNLDLFNTHKLMHEILKEIKEKEKSVIAVIHDMNLASLYCDEIIMLKNGKVIAKDKKDNVLVHDKIKELFNVESEIIDSKGKRIIFSYLDKK